MQVPTYSGRVQQAALPNAPQQQRGSIASEGVFQAPSPPAPRLDPTPGLLADALGKFDAYLEKQRDEQDSIRAEEQVNKLREFQLAATYDPQKGFTSVRGRNAVEPDKNGLGLVERYSGEFDTEVGRLAGELANDAQRRKFQEKAALVGLDFRGQLTRHSSAEFQAHAVNTLKAGVKLESDLAATRLDAPDVVLPDGSKVSPLRISRDRVEASLLKLREQQGWSAAEFDLARRGALTDLHKGVLDAALAKGNVAFAGAYLQQNKDDFTGDGLVDAYRKVQERTLNVDVVATVGKLVSLNQDIPPMSFEAVWKALMTRESNGRQFNPDGTVVTSHKGALGRVQMVPGTGPEAAKLAGLPWSLERLKNDPEYNEALGRAYFAEQLRVFGGNVPKALAAYNAGPGALEKALKKAAQKGTPDAWLAELPAETQKYVPAILARASKGTPRQDVATLEKMLDTRYAGNPEALTRARTELRHQFKLQDDALKERSENALGAVLKALDAGKSYSEVRTLPEYAQLNPKDLDNVQRFADMKAKRGEPETDWGLYTTLSTQPKELLAANLPALRGRLGETEFKELVKQQAKLKNDPAEGTRVETQTAMLNRLLASNGIDPSPKDTEKANWEKVGRYKAALQKEIDALETTKKSKATPEEVEKLANKLLVEAALPRTFFDKKVKIFELPAEPDAAKAKPNIPEYMKQEIIVELKKRGFRDPKPEQVEAVFMGRLK